MELKAIPFATLHRIVISVMEERSALKSEHEKLLFLIGQWYQNWLSSDVLELVLKIPYYEKNLVSIMIEYQYWLDLLIKILDSKPTQELSGHSLFNIMAFKSADRYQRQNGDFEIKYCSSSHNMHRFDQDISVSTDRFVPLFLSEQIKGQSALISQVFSLLVVLGKNNHIPHAVTLDLERNLTLFVQQNQDKIEEKAFARILFTDEFRNDDDKRDAILDAMLDIDFRRCIVVTYPYHVDVSSAVINEFRGRSKIFRIALSNRFVHGDVDSNEVILTKSELSMGTKDEIVKIVDRYSIVKTKATPELINGLRDLRRAWNELKLNVFSNPFPVKWLLCVHHGYTVAFWKNQFINDYPEITGQLLTDSLSIVEQVYELNWIDQSLPTDKEGVLVLPKSAHHSDIISSLKVKVMTQFKEVMSSDEIKYTLAEYGPVYLLDPFNIILLNNLSLGNSPEAFQIIVPDFLYYTYQPFIRYLCLKYHFDALTCGLRSELDELHPDHLAYWINLSGKILKASRKELAEFNRNVSVDKIEEQLEEQQETIIELSANELIERVAIKERKTSQEALSRLININTNKRRLSVRPSTPIVLNQNGVFIQTIAAVLDKGDLFVPINEVIRDMDLKKMIDRLITLSDKARNWHQYLKELADQEAGIFNVLKSQGLSISEQTFEKDYLRDDGSSSELHMPRARQDWMIICECLQIEDSHTAWNAIKCREEINQLKETYSRIIELMINTGNFGGVNVSDSVLNEVTIILAKLPHPVGDTKEDKQDAIALITEICNKISLEKIEQIN